MDTPLGSRWHSASFTYVVRPTDRWLLILLALSVTSFIATVTVVSDSKRQRLEVMAIDAERQAADAARDVKLTVSKLSVLEAKIQSAQSWSAVNSEGKGRSGVASDGQLQAEMDKTSTLLTRITENFGKDVKELHRRVIRSFVSRVKDLLTTVREAKKKGQRKGKQEKLLFGRGDGEESEDEMDADRDDDTLVPGPAYVHPPDPLDKLPVNEKNAQRATQVVREFNHSWDAYVRYAWGSDELRPLTRTGRNWSTAGSLHLSIFDASTTLAVMGLDSELKRVVDFLVHDWDLSALPSIDVSQFESVIRIVGSLVSLYQLTGRQHAALLSKAQAFADRLLPAYSTKFGIPDTTVNLRYGNHSNPSWRGDSTALAEVGTCQLEFRSLTKESNRSRYDRAAVAAMTAIERKMPPDNLPPVFINVSTGEWATSRVAVGGLGDSYYEYLLKQYLLTNRTEIKYKILFRKSIRSITEQLLQYTNTSGMAYVAQRQGQRHKKLVRRFDHLACFLPGVIMLGSNELAADDEERDKWIRIASDLTETCYQMYARQKTGIGPDSIRFPEKAEFINGEPAYLLRPEAMEAMFYAWRVTKNEKFRDYGWRMFKAIRRWCRIDTGGYSGIRRVNDFPIQYDDLQQSFWLAETLKYAYLLFSNESALELNRWVLNTEAHPLQIGGWDPMYFLAFPDKLPTPSEKLPSDVAARQWKHRLNAHQHHVHSTEPEAKGEGHDRHRGTLAHESPTVGEARHHHHRPHADDPAEDTTVSPAERKRLHNEVRKLRKHGEADTDEADRTHHQRRTSRPVAHQQDGDRKAEPPTEFQDEERLQEWLKYKEEEAKRRHPDRHPTAHQRKPAVKPSEDDETRDPKHHEREHPHHHRRQKPED